MNITIKKLNFDLKYILLTIVSTILLIGYYGLLGQYSLVLSPEIKMFWKLMVIMCKYIIIVFIIVDLINNKKVRIKKATILIALFLIFLGCISIIVSIDKISTINRLVDVYFTIIFGVYLVNKFNIKQLIDLMSNAQIVFLLFLLYFMLKYPEYAFFMDKNGNSVLTGLYTTKNPCGFELIFGGLLFYYKWKIEKIHFKQLWFILFLFQLFLVFKTYSIGPLITGIVSIGLAEFYFKKKNNRLCFIYLLCTVGFLLVIFVGLPLFSNLLQLIGRDITLTGRTNIWRSILGYLKQDNLLFGYGYESFWDFPSLTNNLYYTYVLNGVRQQYVGAHNALIENILNFGVIGSIILYFIILYILQRFNFKNKKIDLFILIFFFFFSIRGMVERSFSDSSYDTLIIIMVLTLIIKNSNIRKYNKIRYG